MYDQGELKVLRRPPLVGREMPVMCRTRPLAIAEDIEPGTLATGRRRRLVSDEAHAGYCPNKIPLQVPSFAQANNLAVGIPSVVHEQMLVLARKILMN
jgi:hypothetical protein